MEQNRRVMSIDGNGRFREMLVSEQVADRLYTNLLSIPGMLFAVIWNTQKKRVERSFCSIVEFTDTPSGV